MRTPEERSLDAASRQMLKRAADEGVSTSWDRWEAIEPHCGFGRLGICCVLCDMGPCRVDPFGEGAQAGACGATADVIAARNLARKIAAGTAAHSDHGRSVCHALLEAATGQSDYKIKDPKKLRVVAGRLGIAADGKGDLELAKAVGEACLAQFGQQEGELPFLRRAPKKRQDLWHEKGLAPRGIDREVVTLLHQTGVGVDADFRSMIAAGIRCALADGWGGSMVATDLQDVLFGSPQPIRAKTNLGVLGHNLVNVLIHGHEPVLSEMIVEAARDPELIAQAKAAGAEGINVAGICCTANEVLMRHGVPSAGTFLQQELAVVTGAVDAMVVDVQCWMPSLPEVAGHYHTKLITTSDRAKAPGVEHIQFEEKHALANAREIVSRAIEAFKERDPKRVMVPEQEVDLIAGFTAEYVHTLLGGRFRPSYRPLNDAIIAGRIRGVAGVVGCENVRSPEGAGHLGLIKELIKHDVLVVSTGCSALAAAREGLLVPEAAAQHAGRGLQEVCEAVGMPPVLHVGSCVDNSRILIACCEILAEGGLGEDISDLPVAGAAPEWMSEKAIAIGWYAVGSGIFTVFGHPQPVMGSENLHRYMVDEVEELVGAKYAFEPDPVQAAHVIIEHMNRKREALKLRPMMYESYQPAEAAG